MTVQVGEPDAGSKARILGTAAMFTYVAGLVTAPNRFGRLAHGVAAVRTSRVEVENR